VNRTQNIPNDPPHNRGLHWLAILTAVATFPLIFMGGLVTSHDVGLSVPDWPNSYGYNMFLFPYNKWVGGIWYEHVHRLMGTVVGFCATLLVLHAWGVGRRETVRRWLLRGGAAMLILAVSWTVSLTVRQAGPSRSAQGMVGVAGMGLVLFAASFARRPEPRRWVRWLATAVLGAVIFQGVLGGLRVVLLKLDLAIVHACVAQAFFCLAILTCVVTSRWWTMAATQRIADDPRGRKLIRLATIVWFIVYAQLIVGATMRHYKAGLAIPDLPLAYGKLLPPTSEDALAKVNDARALNWDDPVSMTQVWLAFGHRIGAVAVSIAVILLAVRILRRRATGGLTRPAWALLVLLSIQLTLGVLTVLLKKPADVASYHVAVGAAVLATTFLIAARSMRLYGRAARLVSEDAPVRGAFPVFPKESLVTQ
jgi:cytochrome c oxidase assembly protein subunit 15